MKIKITLKYYFIPIWMAKKIDYNKNYILYDSTLWHSRRGKISWWKRDLLSRMEYGRRKGLITERYGRIFFYKFLLKYSVLILWWFSLVQLLSHVWLSATPWTAAFQASLSYTNVQSLLKLMSIESVMPSNHLVLCHPLLLLPSIFPSMRVFSDDSALHIRWPDNWKWWWWFCGCVHWQSSLNCKLATDTFYCMQMVPQESWLKMDGRLPSAEVFSTQQLRNGLTEAHPGTFQLPCLSVNVSFYPLRPGEASRDIVKTWRPQGDIKTTPTTSAPAFSPGSYGTLKLWGRFKFCRISSFCFSWKITVIVKSTQELYEFKKLPMSPITFPKVTHIHNILYVW